MYTYYEGFKIEAHKDATTTAEKVNYIITNADSKAVIKAGSKKGIIPDVVLNLKKFIDDLSKVKKLSDRA